MTLADGIQLVIAAATFAAAIAAWIAARSSRDSASQIRVTQQIESHNARIAALQELLGLVASLAEGVNVMNQGEGYVRGARIRGLIVLTGHPLPACVELGESMRQLNAPAGLIVRGEEDIHSAVRAEQMAIASLETAPKPRRFCTRRA